MEALYIIRDGLCKNLEEIAEAVEQEGCVPARLTAELDKLTHSLKSIEATLAMYESGYSRDDGYSGRHSYGGSSMDGGSSGGSYGRGYSERRGRSRTTGRFVSRESGYSGRRGYSRDGGEQDITQEIDNIMRDTSDNNVKQRLNSLKQKMMGGNEQ